MQDAMSVVPIPGFTQEETLALALKWLELGADPTNYGINSALIPHVTEYAHIDETLLTKEDCLFSEIDKAIIVDFSAINSSMDSTDPEFKYFMVSAKRCYNKPMTRHHLVKYLNYFEKFYDTDHELIMIYYRIKYFMDYVEMYNEDNLTIDLSRYIIHNPSLLEKLNRLDNDNYIVALKRKRGKTISNLQYDTKHGKILMKMSLIMDMCIPLVTHFITCKKLASNDLILKVFDIIISNSSVDIFSKLYETASYEVEKNQKIHSPLWDKQDIRGIDTLTHSLDSINNIILNIMPKYVYSKNIISLNSTSIKKNTTYNITDIPFEFNFKRLISSNRDEDFNSEFDKYEAYQIRQDENLYLQNKVNCLDTMRRLELMFGPVSDDEIRFYRERLSEDRSDNNIIVDFQKDRIFNLFFKYFGEPISMYDNNSDGYIKLIIMAKRYLLSCNMIALPHILGGKVNRISNRKSINLKEKTEIEASDTWRRIDEKYNYNQKIKDQIFSEIATIITSSFSFIDYYDKELDGLSININSTSIIREEYLNYILLI